MDSDKTLFEELDNVSKGIIYQTTRNVLDNYPDLANTKGSNITLTTKGQQTLIDLRSKYSKQI